MASTQDKINQDRTFIAGQGEQNNQEARTRANESRQKRSYLQGYLDEVYDPLIGGRGGYSPEEAAAITRESQFNAGMTTPEEFQANYLTPDEESAIKGDPSSVWSMYDPGAFYDTLGATQRGEDAAVAGMREGYAAAIDPAAMAYQKQKLRDPTATLDRTKLAQSSEMAARAQMTPEEQQNMVTAAGISSGAGYRAAIADLERKGRAAGMDPLGVAALRAQMETQAAADAGDSMTKARVAADAAAAERDMALEGQRISAEQGLAGMQMSGANYLNQADITQEGQRAQSQQDIARAKMAATADVGQAAIQTAANQGNRALSTQQYLQDTGMKTQADVEATQSQRAGQVAANRQGVSQANQGAKFDQNYNTQGAISSGAQAVANARKQEQQEGRQYLFNQQQMENANEQSDYDRQNQIYTGRGNLQLGNTAQQASWDTRPKTWEKIGGMAIGAASAAAGFPSIGGRSGGGKAEGGVVTEPTYAMVGENGPEAIVPLNPGPQTKQNPLRRNFTYGPPPAQPQAQAPAAPNEMVGSYLQPAAQPQPAPPATSALPAWLNQQVSTTAVAAPTPPQPQAGMLQAQQVGSPGFQGKQAEQKPSTGPMQTAAPAAQGYGQILQQKQAQPVTQQPKRKPQKSWGAKPARPKQRAAGGGYGPAIWQDRAAAAQQPQQQQQQYI